MQAQVPRSDRGGSIAALGSAILVIGVIAYFLEMASIDIASWLGGSGWTLFIIGPGLALLAGSLFLRDGAALLTLIMGAVLTTVGGLLLFQDQTDRYDTWAYAWALIPGAVGAALAVHGLRFHRPDLVSVGTRMVAGFAVVLIAGAWFFETIFSTDRPPFDLGENWPLVLIGLGGLLFLGGLLRGSTGSTDEAAPRG
jgi:hypothetical protein